MTCGIYMLKFLNSDKVYIGQSVNIEERFKQHLRNLKNNKSSKKLLNAHKEYGIPVLHILEICNNLDEKELIYINKFNSVENGYNSSFDTCHGVALGDNNGSSKYSNSKIIEVFTYLTTTDYTYTKISLITNVHKSVIQGISAMRMHKWLKDIYPIEYCILQDKLGNRLISDYPEVISPEGIVYKIDSIRSFCKVHNLTHTCLGRVLKGLAPYHKGWKLHVNN